MNRKRGIWRLAALLMVGGSLSMAHAQEPAAQATAQTHWNVMEAGAVPDGKTDDTAAFQKALDAAGRAGGGVVDVPAGRYRIDGTLSVPASVTLQGTYHVPPTPEKNADGDLTGSVLLAYAGRGSEQGPPFIRLAGSNAVLSGLIVTYPEWKQTDVPPVPYPPCVFSQDTANVGILDCCFLNPYEAIRLVRAARHLVRNVTGYPSKRGVFVDECYDIGHIENVHFWPFGVDYKPDDPFCHWINTHGVAFELARTDWQYVFNTFCFGYGVGYKFSESKTGSANGNFLGLGADSCQRAVVVEQAQPPGLLITNGEFVGRWSSRDAVCVEIGSQVEGTVSLTNCSFWGPIDHCIWMRSPEGQITANACHFVNWDVAATGSPAIQLDAGKAIVNGCTFAQEGLDVRVGDRVVSAILMGNQASGGLQIENRAGKHMQAFANEQDSIAWTPAARLHYRIEIGAEGDGRYLRSWNGRERFSANGATCTMRWSTPASQLFLPVVPGKPYTLALAMNVPEAALAPDAGIYLEGKRVAVLHAGEGVRFVPLPPAHTDRITLELRCRGWVPSRVEPGSHDDRTLGVSVYSVEMRAEGSGRKIFNANTDQ
ncbi:MAG TPA: glycosyl hydrolase family 28-related protein [Chthonomonadaceae bacterium]|nr:glycosyl hydrolase family 28-related protein [Chthonomonadaceae bacterium]